jgi:hypothetical protein
MKENEILEEIHRGRAEHARECGYDVHKIFEGIREGTERLKAEGWEIVSPPPRETESPLVMRDELPKK